MKRDDMMRKVGGNEGVARAARKQERKEAEAMEARRKAEDAQQVRETGDDSMRRVRVRLRALNDAMCG